MYHVVTPRSFHYRPDDTGGAAHSCAAGHTTYDKVPPDRMGIVHEVEVVARVEVARVKVKDPRGKCPIPD